MERLTSNKQLTEWELMNLSVTNMYERLKFYEDAEEQGRLIVLPCNIGDTVYYIRGEYHDKSHKTVEAIRVTEISVKNDINGKLLPPAIIANGCRYRFTSIGKSVFLTREEAERALVGMK